MHKNEIDRHFTSKHNFFTKVTKAILYNRNYRPHLTVDTIINESYMYVVKNGSKIETEVDLEKMVVNWIKMNIQWNNSDLNKKEMLDSIYTGYKETNEYFDEDDNSQLKTITKNIETEDTIDECLTEKIEIEKWYNEKKAILQLYRYQETNKIKQIIFDCYFTKGIVKGKELAKHLDINTYYAYRYIRELKEDLKEFIKNNQY